MQLIDYFTLLASSTSQEGFYPSTDSYFKSNHGKFLNHASEFVGVYKKGNMWCKPNDKGISNTSY